MLVNNRDGKHWSHNIPNPITVAELPRPRRIRRQAPTTHPLNANALTSSGHFTQTALSFDAA